MAYRVAWSPRAVADLGSDRTNPLLIRSRATKTVFVDQPIIMWDEVKSLTSDGTRSSFKDDYAVILYVSEVFADGSQWTGQIE